MRTRVLIVICAVVLSAAAGRAQNLYSGNPADPTLLEALFSNPALNARITERIAVALTAHQVGVAGGGFVGVRSGIISYHLPWQMRGAAAGVQYLSAGLYTRNDLRVSYGSRVWRKLSAGVNLDLLMQSFDQSKFFHVDMADPLLRGGTDASAFSLGLGATLDVYRAITVGVSVQNLNRPSLALGSDPARIPLEFSLGIRAQLRGAGVSSALNALPVRSERATQTAMNDAGQHTRFGVDVPIGRFRLRASSDANETHFEGEAPLYGHLYLNYRYAYPQSAINVVSSGTNRFGFIYDFNRLPPVDALPLLPALPELPALPVAAGGEPRGFFAVMPSVDSVDIMAFHLRRQVDPELTTAGLDPWLPGLLTARTGMLRDLPAVENDDPRARLRGIYSTRYRTALESIAMQLKDSSSASRASVVSHPGGERRANALVNLMTGDRIAVKQPVPILTSDREPELGELSALLTSGEELKQQITPAEVSFRIVPVGARPVRSWRMEIRDGQERLVREFAGSGDPPESLVWNLRDSAPAQLTGGVYTFALQTVDEFGRSARSAGGAVEIIQRRQSRTIDITRQPRARNRAADQYILILGADPRTRTPHPVEGEK